MRPCVWSETPASAVDAAAVVIRSPWDYHLRHGEFLGWVDELDRARLRVFNDPVVLRWNANKRYLDDLAARDIPIVPTMWLTPAGDGQLREALAKSGWRDAIVKPAVSASAWQTWRTSLTLAGEHQLRVSQLLERGDVLLQPFIEEIETDGEWSIMFFAGEFSHGVRKRASRGDFRVQAEYGGTAESEQPTRSIVAGAARALAATPTDEPALYARVDGVVIGGAFTVMELELLDPVLFFALEPASAQRFAEALARHLAD